MELLMLFAVPGVLGGIAIAVFFIRLNRGRHSRAPADAFGGEPATDIINAARIRVAGVGGLGLVAVALGVAMSIPWIGLSLGLGLVLGAILAAVLILRRRREGPMPSSGRRPGANTTLSIDARLSAKDEDDDYPSNMSTRELPAFAAATSRLV